MLAIRMQRTGRKGHAMFRIIVQDARLTPTSGKVVARLGNYDPHAKTIALDKERAAFYLDHGAQPSSRAARLLKDEGVKLPAWVKSADVKKREVRNADKRRSTRPAEAEAPVEAPAEAPAAEKPADETSEAPAPTEVAAEQEGEVNSEEAAVAEEAPAEEAVPAEETPAEEAPAEQSEQAPAEEAADSSETTEA